MHNYAGFGADTAPVHAKTEFDKNTRGGYHEYKVYSDIEDTRSSNRVEPPNSICTAVRVGRVRIGQKVRGVYRALA